ncbi:MULTISPECIES: hypothetical protein [unclassified Haladaptatus]|uniref:hypothetical protein n=1 Tax=unclassified Haladaptatus TaxID=2622732 RepID=UPI00209BD173|nr:MULTISPECIES: hypothetical protein [unclassified Haladaptatus]MCO8245441.1 hypothetical protein [Haladaptatus sp. AB643]MCO8256552.1 hypothetical protein [Haladaptatus sp. AB618]
MARTIKIGTDYGLGGGSYTGRKGAYVKNGGVAGNHAEAWDSAGFVAASAGTLAQSQTGSWAEVFQIIDVVKANGRNKGDIRIQFGGHYEGGMSAIIGYASVKINAFLYNVTLNRMVQTEPIFTKSIQYAGQKKWCTNYTNQNIVSTVYAGYRYRVGIRLEAVASSDGIAYGSSDWYEPINNSLPTVCGTPGYANVNKLRVLWPAI